MAYADTKVAVPIFFRWNLVFCFVRWYDLFGMHDPLGLAKMGQFKLVDPWDHAIVEKTYLVRIGEMTCLVVEFQALWKIWKSVGMMKFPTEWKNKIHVPNHQPVTICESEGVSHAGPTI